MKAFYILIIFLLVGHSSYTISFAHGESVKKAKKNSKMNSDHSHNHSAHKHSHSGFSLGLGTMYNKALAKDKQTEPEDHHHEAQQEDHEHSLVQSKALMLDGSGAHSHGEHSSNSGNSTNANSGLMFYLRPGYQISSVELSVNLSLVPEGGLLDPLVGLDHRLAINKRTDFISNISASIPVSEDSAKVGKLTTLSARMGPGFTFGKLSAGFSGIVAYNLYNKPLQGEQEAASLKVSNTGFTLIDGDHGQHTEPQTPTGSQQRPTGQQRSTTGQNSNAQATAARQSSPAGNDQAASEQHHDDHEDDRDNIAVGGGLNLGYAFSKKFRTDHNADLIMMNSALGKNSYLTQINIIRASYSLMNFTTFGLFGMTSAPTESVSTPSIPTIGLGLDYKI